MMLKTIRYVFLLLALASFLQAEEPLVVHLLRTGSLRPIYLDAFTDKDAGLSASYLSSLEKVLRFDLDHNGKTKTLPRSKEFTAIVNKEKGANIFHAANWQAQNVLAAIKVEVSEKQLKAYIFLTQSKETKAVEKITLSGQLQEDRRKIHLLADSFYEMLFKEKGIATTRILYTVKTKTGEDSTAWQSEVWEADYDGANARKITSQGKLAVTPSYVPIEKGHPKQFLYTSYQTGQPKIYLSSLITGASKRLTLMRGNQLMPAASSKSKLVAFISDILGNPEVFLQSFDPEKGLLDKPWQVTSFPKGAQGSPTFNPEGTKLAFVSNKDGGAKIYVTPIPKPGASAKDLKPTLLTKMNKENTCPAWSPDGKKLAYSAKTKGVRQIWIYDFQASKEVQVTDGPGDKESPSWAPNSQHLIFHSSSKTASDLHFIHLAEQESVKITSGSGEKRFPSWEPYIR